MQKEKKSEERRKLVEEGRRAPDLEGLDLSKRLRAPEEKSHLRERFGRNLSTDFAILDCFENPADQDSGTDLLLLEERTEDKKVLKEIRAALYRLKQKGIKLPEEGHRFEPPRGEPEVEAYLGPIDGEGQRTACLFKPIPGMGTLVLQALIHDERGMLQTVGGFLPKKEVRNVQKQLRDTFRAVPANWKRVDAILHDAHRKARDSSQTGLQQYPEIRQAFSSSEPEQPWSPLTELPIEIHALAGEPTARLLEEPELSDWTLPEETVSEWAEELEKVLESPLILNRYQQRDRIQDTIQSATAQLLARGRLRELYGNRLEEMAEYFYRQGQLPETQLAVHASLELKDWTQERKPPAFFMALVQRSLALGLESKERKKKEEVPLIVRP